MSITSGFNKESQLETKEKKTVKERKAGWILGAIAFLLIGISLGAGIRKTETNKFREANVVLRQENTVALAKSEESRLWWQQRAEQKGQIITGQWKIITDQREITTRQWKIITDQREITTRQWKIITDQREILSSNADLPSSKADVLAPNKELEQENRDLREKIKHLWIINRSIVSAIEYFAEDENKPLRKVEDSDPTMPTETPSMSEVVEQPQFRGR